MNTPTLAAALVAALAITTPAAAQETCGPIVEGPEASSQACTTPLNPAEINCHRLPHQGRDPRTGDIEVTLTVCTQREHALARQLRIERRRWALERRALLQRATTAEARAARVWRPTVDHAIHLAAKAYGVDHGAMRRVARCESTMNPHAQNGQYLGLFQTGVPFWRSTPFSAFHRTDPYANALATAHVVSRQGWRQWECKP